MINQLIYSKWVSGVGGWPHTLRVQISIRGRVQASQSGAWWAAEGSRDEHKMWIWKTDGFRPSV